MTTPAPQGGGFLNNLLGGITGTLAGANPLQSSIDQLTQAVNRLSTQMSMGGNLTMSSAANQQGNYTGTLRFPQVNTPGMNRQQGIGGGGQGGAGNVTPPQPFGRLGSGLAGGIMLGGAFAGYGQQQMPFQIGLNQYAANSMMGIGGAGMSNFGANFSALSNQPGMPISSNSMDYLQMMQSLSFLAGAPKYMSTALGRAGFGAAASFGLTNPALSGAMSGNLAQQIYNPMLSMRMRLLGYNTTPRVMGSGMPQSIGNIAASLIQAWYGRNSVNAGQLSRTLSMGGKGFTNLQYLGLNPQQMTPLLEGYNRLFNAGYSPEAASQLFSKAASNNPSVFRPAQAKLTQLGVTSVSSDIQKLKNNQSQVTQRSVNTAAGFDAALTTTTDSLQRFNQGLNAVLNTLHLNGLLGGAGGLMGVLSGTNHGNALLGLGGAALMARGLGLFGGGGAAAGGAAGAAGRGALGGFLAGPGMLLGEAGILSHLTNNYHRSNTGAGSGIPSWMRDPANWANNLRGWGATGISTALHWMDPFNWFGGGTSSRVGGGSGASVPQTRQNQSKTSAMATSGVSSSAIRAVDMAESQIGVPYVWGGEQPGVGFDCSGLVQWAYKQAGVNLPRTSEEQYAALRRKMVPLKQVQAGDIVFAAGSDGTASNPGHEGLMINSRQLVQAPFTGEDVQIIGYDPKAWVAAARPTGKGNFAMGIANSPINNGASALGLYGNTGAGMGLGNYGSVNEVDIINSMGAGGGLGGAGLSAFGAGLQFPNKNNSLGNTTSAPKNLAGLKAVAMQLLRAKNWGNQWAALNNIITHESSWNVHARNPSSGAYGLPQALPGSKMAAAGSDWMNNGATQLKWMIDMYIPKAYGNPNNAWQFWQQNGWYGGGGWQRPGTMSVVGDRGPELMISGGSGNLVMNNAQTMQLLKSISNPQQTPWKNLTASQYDGKVITPGQATSMSSGMCINVTFAQNSIHVNMNNSSASPDMQSVGRNIAQQTVAQLEREIMLSTIAMGVKN